MKKKNSSKSGIFRLLTSPARLFNTRIRLSIALTCAVLSMILFAQLIEIIPNPNQPTMAARKLQTETLALTGSALAESGVKIADFEKTLENTVKRDKQLISIGLRNAANRLDIEVGPHQRHWQMPEDKRSTDRFMFVPIMRGDTQIGQLEMCYEPLISVASWFKSATAQLILFMFATCFLLFNLIVYRTMKQLDPRGAVPQRVREAFDNMAEGLMILDRYGRIMLANSKFGSIVGIDQERLIGIDCSDFPWITQGNSQLPWERVIRENQAITAEPVQICDVDSVLRTFNVSSAPILGHKGSCRGVMVTFDDITALEEHRRDLIEARQAADDANLAKSKFLSRMSHEIRTPMNAILGYTEVLQFGIEDDVEKRAQHLSTIQTSGEHLLDLINDILDLSKIESGQIEIEPKRISIHELISNAVSTLGIKAKEKGICLEYHVNGKLPEFVHSDEVRVKQVIINLIGNAIKFTEQGGVVVMPQVVDVNGKPMLSIRVADSGIGMTPEAMEKIFDPFSQADISITRRFGGTGLGLTICRELAEKLGGDISVTSQPGEGSIFTFTLDPGDLSTIPRLEASQLETTRKRKIQKSEQVMELPPAKVLIVDDGESNRELVALFLKRARVPYEFAVNGQIAVEMVMEGDFDVVLMDMHMPVMDGFRATRILREQGYTLPIIALTANALAQDERDCRAAGCSGFLAKPIKRERLFEAIAEALPDTNVHGDKWEDVRAQQGINRTLSFDQSQTLSQPGATLTMNSERVSHETFHVTHPMVDASQPSLDGSVDFIESSLPMDDEDFVHIANLFVKHLKNKVNLMIQAIEKRDFGQLRELGHWLKGAGGSAGFDAFNEPGKQLEDSALAQDFNAVSSAVAEIRCMTARIRVVSEAETAL